MNNKDCVFCRIAKKQKEAEIIYEDKSFMAFLDKRPLTKGNSLVIPKKHCVWADDVEHFGEYFEVAKKVGKASKKALIAQWVQYITIGNEIPHAHIRVIPRYNGDKHGPLPSLQVVENYSQAETAQIADRIRKEIC